MPKFATSNRLKEYAFIVIGVFLLAISINVFFEPSKLVTGGFSGMSIILNSYFKTWFGVDISLGTLNLALNIPLFIIYFFTVGRDAIFRTGFATVLFSVALELTLVLHTFTGDMLLAAVYGGVISGVGIGLVFRGMATTGGVDMIAAIIKKYKPHIPIAKSMFVCDSLIVLFGLFVFGAQRAMYAIIAVFISSKCIDAILEGMAFAKAALIISSRSDEISKQILEKLNRGVTSLKGNGMYTGEEKDILICVFAQKEISKIKEIVHDIDKNAFVIVTDVKEVLGEGFEPIK